MYYYYRKGAEREKVFLFFSSSSTLGVHSMVAITLRPGGAPSTPREHHDEALKSEARAPFGGGGGCSSSSRWVELWCRFLLSRSFLDAISKCWWFLFQVLCARAPDRVLRQERNENKTDCFFFLCSACFPRSLFPAVSRLGGQRGNHKLIDLSASWCRFEFRPPRRAFNSRVDGSPCENAGIKPSVSFFLFSYIIALL